MSKWIFFMVLFLQCAWVHAETVTMIPRYDTLAYDNAITALYQAQPKKPLVERIHYFSQAFLGQPYVGGALGEGPTGRFDKSPLYRTDGFDCMTYVSTVLALVNAQDLQAFKNIIKKVRYDHAKVVYRHRNHFTSVDWNVNNHEQGFIEDITEGMHDEHYHPIAQIATANINKKAWYENKPLSTIKLFSPITASKQGILLNKLHAQANYVDNQESHLPYIPLSALFDTQGEPNAFIFNQIPSGAIVEIVRPNWDLTAAIGTHLNVSHLGFAIRTDDGLMYREASLTEHKIIDIPLADYLKPYLNSSTVKGINLQRVLERA